MRRYSVSDEEKIRAQHLVREWSRSGLLQSSQTPQIEAELRVEFRRTNHFLRAVLFGFTILIAAASVLLIFTIFKLNEELPAAVTSFVAAIVCFGLAEYLITRFRLYRFGVEEGFAAAAALLLSLGAALLASNVRSAQPVEFPILIGLFVGALSSYGIYRRFGYVYAAVGSMICAVMIPFQLNMAAETQRLLVAEIFAVVFVMVRSKRRQHGHEIPGDDYGIMQAFAWAGLYLALNLQIEFRATQGRFYWLTYMMIWILPVIGLRKGLREKDRALIDLSLGMTLLTLVTNKSYRGLAHQPWDPILFGILLMATAIALRRWLSKGVDGQRYGFTPARALTGDNRVLGLVGTASAALQPDLPAAASGPAKPDFGGGRSGGAGASGSF